MLAGLLSSVIMAHECYIHDSSYSVVIGALQSGMGDWFFTE